MSYYMYDVVLYVFCRIICTLSYYMYFVLSYILCRIICIICTLSYYMYYMYFVVLYVSYVLCRITCIICTSSYMYYMYFVVLYVLWHIICIICTLSYYMYFIVLYVLYVLCRILLRHCNEVYNQNPIDRWMKGCILHLPKKGDLRLAKNYRGITLTSIAAKIYNALLRNRIEPKIDNTLRKNQNGFRRNRSTTSQILTIRRILEGVQAKNLQTTLLFVDFTKAFDSIHRRKMEQSLLAYGLPKETVAVIRILYKNTKVKVRSPDGDTEYFDIVAGVLQGDTLAPYLFIICLDYVLRTSSWQRKEAEGTTQKQLPTPTTPMT